MDIGRIIEDAVNKAKTAHNHTFLPEGHTNAELLDDAERVGAVLTDLAKKGIRIDVDSHCGSTDITVYTASKKVQISHPLPQIIADQEQFDRQQAREAAQGDDSGAATEAAAA